LRADEIALVPQRLGKMLRSIFMLHVLKLRFTEQTHCYLLQRKPFGKGV
jgi:hypothetical protein